MKPLGTITMCFPHVDYKTRNILQGIMDEAENYADFTERLCQAVLSEAASKLLEYLAFNFSFGIRNFRQLDRLEQAGKIPKMAEPLLFVFLTMTRESAYWKQMNNSLLCAVNDAPNDWFASQIYLTWKLGAENLYEEIHDDIKPTEIILSNVNSNEELECFKPYLLVLEADKYRKERNTGDELALLNEALTFAQKFDEQVLATSIQIRMANRLKHTNLSAAIDLLQSAEETSEKLGLAAEVQHIHSEMGQIRATRGEFNEAIEYQLKCLSYDHEKIPLNPSKLVIAFYYNQIGDGQNALEFVSSGYNLAYIKHRMLCLPYIQTAWALINLGRCDKAKLELAFAHEIMLQSADNLMLIFYHLVEGILDKMDNKIDAASRCFEDVLKSIENNPTIQIENICLLNLTEIEIKMLDEETLDEDSEMSGPWMQNLFEHSKTKELPGIIARAKILQATLRQKQKRFQDMTKLLDDVLTTANQYPSMRYLSSLVKASFPDFT